MPSSISTPSMISTSWPDPPRFRYFRLALKINLKAMASAILWPRPFCIRALWEIWLWLKAPQLEDIDMGGLLKKDVMEPTGSAQRAQEAGGGDSVGGANGRHASWRSANWWRRSDCSEASP